MHLWVHCERTAVHAARQQNLLQLLLKVKGLSRPQSCGGNNSFPAGMGQHSVAVLSLVWSTLRWHLAWVILSHSARVEI